MPLLKILISHGHDEKGLASAWKELIETISAGALEVWFSSDTHAEGGMAVGKEWRENLYRKLAESNFILAIQTPFSFTRPWIMWECGVASGIEKARGIIPIVYLMGRGDLANPLSTYQVYEGEDPEQVRQVCERLAHEAGLRPANFTLDESIKVYLRAVDLHRPRMPLRTEQMTLWRDRFEKLVQSGRVDEVMPMRQLMYTSLKPFQAVEPTIHELLSRILLEQREYMAAIEEVDYALTLIKDDVQLLHRKALAVIELQNLLEAENLVKHILSLNEELSLNPEIASLQGRIHRERWELTQEPAELDAAIAAYYRAYEADKTQYYPGINVAELALTKGDTNLAEQIFQEILDECKELQKRPIVSYWVDFTVGAAYLGQGDIDGAIAAYSQGLKRIPSPPPRDRESAARGVYRMATAKHLPDDVIEKIKAILE
jgi:tetratricopeptide (TPR) repeat protein